jgi:hypothetical protein
VALPRIRQLRLALVVVALGATPACVGMSVPTANSSTPLWGALEPRVNRLGSDYKNFELPDADPELCRAACDDDPKCRAFTYVKPGLQGPKARCWLKDPVPAPRKDEDCCVSGVKPVPEPEDDADAGPR